MNDNSTINKAEEVANQAENIAISALIRLTSSIKEALSFLNVLYEESEIDGFDQQYLAFKNIFGFLKSDVQNTLSKLDLRTYLLLMISLNFQSEKFCCLLLTETSIEVHLLNILLLRYRNVVVHSVLLMIF